LALITGEPAAALPSASQFAGCLRRPAHLVSRYAGGRRQPFLRSRIRIEIILDVVYNHTTEGKEDGPTIWIARAMNGIGPSGMWDEEDGFYYDVLRLPDGNAARLKVRSMVGLLPLCATTIIQQFHARYDGGARGRQGGTGRP
jgi:hypothetical protein